METKKTTKPTKSAKKAVEIKDPVVSETKQDLTEETDSVTVVIPYLKSQAAGEELLYAVRSWQENFAQKIKLVVVGDKEDWFNEEVTHIPHVPRPGVNAQMDVAEKLLLAITSGAVKGEFILSNDDIFLIGPTNLEFLKLLKSSGDVMNKGQEGGIYRENANRTASLLHKNGFRTKCFGTHTPMVLNAEKLSDVLMDYKALDQGILITSAYFNTVHPDARGVIPVSGGANCNILASVYREKPSLEVLLNALQTRLFINCNSVGWTALKPILERAFTTKSKLEI